MDIKIKQCQGGSLHLVKVPKEKESSIVREVTAAVERSSDIFEYRKTVEIVVFSSSKLVVIPEIGMTGNAIMHGDITIDIDFSRKDINDIIHKHLPSTIYHEFSHIVREELVGGYGKTLLEALVSEGIGSYVEKEMSGLDIPYIQSIKNEGQFWQRAKRVLNKRKYIHYEWFFGAGKIPRWTGYRLGYLLVSSFMSKNKDISFAKLVRTKSQDVLRGSGMA